MGLRATDRDIRAVLKKQLREQYEGDSSTLILDELGLRHGKARVDLAVVNGVIHGFEIKSDSDTLKRLPSQVNIFSSVLDHITLVVAERHANEARGMIPRWWGVDVVRGASGKPIQIHRVRVSKPNPSIDPTSVARLLWRAEALNILENIGEAAGVRSRPRSAIYRRLVERLPPNNLRELTRQCLLKRQAWRLALL